MEQVKLYSKIGNILEKNFIILLGIAALICLIIVNVAVLARTLNISISWSDEIIKIIFIYIIYIGAALAYRGDGLIGITMLEEKLFEKNKKSYVFLKKIQHFIILAFSLFCIYQSYLMCLQQLRFNEVTPALEIPAMISTLGFFIGSILWTFYSLEKLITSK